MEMEYQEHNRKGKFIIVLGVVLAIVAGGAAFYLVSQAQQQASTTAVPKVPVVVAARTIPARKAIEAADVVVKEMPADAVGAGAVADPAQLLNRVPAVTILEGQIVTSNLLASTEIGGQFSILKPDETVSPDSPFWRAVAITVPDDRAVAGLVGPGMTVDVFLTATVNLPPMASPGAGGTGTTLAGTSYERAQFMTDKSTKISYQDVEILAKVGTAYVIRVPIGVAEEIEHLQAAGTVQFSMALRPAQDARIADASKLGATTNLVIERYGLPIPMYPVLTGPIYTGSTSAFPIPTSAPGATTASAPGASPAPSAAPAASSAP